MRATSEIERSDSRATLTQRSRNSGEYFERHAMVLTPFARTRKSWERSLRQTRGVSFSRICPSKMSTLELELEFTPRDIGLLLNLGVSTLPGARHQPSSVMTNVTAVAAER